ncbi:MAG: alpha/beta hydrolase [Candidatus Zixiibacteriota bacterium]
MRRFRMLVWPIIIIAGFFVLMLAYLYFNQKNMVFLPSRELSVHPDQLGLEYDDIYIETVPDQRIHGWFISAPDRKTDKVVLFCHGNAGNISHRLETAEFLTSLGADVLLIDYRGYGLSDGEVGEESAYADAMAAYQWLLKEKAGSADRIVIFGRSLGGAVAIELATKVECGGLIVESTFASIKDMAQRMFPFLPTGLLLRYGFDSVGKIAQVNCPVLVTHSQDDDMIPYEMGCKLFEAAVEPKQFVELSGGHNDRQYLQLQTYRNAIWVFLGPQDGT